MKRYFKKKIQFSGTVRINLNFINIRKTEKLASKFVEKELEKV